MRESARPRREINRRVILVVKPFFRYSLGRDAYVLRGVGNRIGPVLRARGESSHDRHLG